LRPSIEYEPLTQEEVAAYTAELLASIRRLSEKNNLKLLAHLVELARLEALRNASGGN